MNARLARLLERLSHGQRVVLGWVGGLLAAYTLAGFLLVPWFIGSAIRREAPKHLHRTASVARVRFNPFSLRTALIGFELRDRDSTALVTFDTLVVNLSIGSLPYRALILDEFRLVRPVVVARLLADGSPAIADLLPAPAARPDSARRDTAPVARTGADTTAAARAPAVPPRLVVHEASIIAGQVVFKDESRAPRLEMRFSDLGASVSELSTLPDDQGNHDLVVTFGGGARLEWKGDNTFQPLHLEGAVTVAGINLSRFADIFGGRWPITVTSGNAAVALRYVVDQAPDGRLQVTIPDASVDARNAALRPRGAAEDWLRVQSLEVHGIQARLPQRTARVTVLRVSDLWVAAAREADGTLNWQPVVDSFRALADTAPSEPSPPWTAVLDTVELANATIALADRKTTPAAALTISELLVRLTGASTDSTRRIGVEVGMAVERQGRVSVAGGVVRAPLDADLTVEARALPLRPVQPYLGARPPARVDSGTASVRGRLRMQARRPSMVFDGGASVDGLAVHDTVGDPMLAWRTMAVRGIHYTRDPDLLRIAAITVEQPFIRVAVSRDRQLNLSAVMNAIPQDTARSLPWEILQIALRNGRIDFSDQSLVLPFRTLIDSAQGTIRDVAAFGATPGSMDIAGVIPPAGAAHATGHLNVADPFAATDIAVQIRNFVMSELTPYSAQFMGYSISSGRLDMDLDYHIQHRQLQANHHIVTTSLTLGPAVEGGESPGFLVKLALSLMRDSEGRITLDVPLAGSVDDPQFSYRDVMWQGVKTVLRRVATAPFRFLGHLLGISGEDPELVEFEPGRADLMPPERVKLDTLAGELIRRPELTIGVEGRYDSVADLRGLQEAMLTARIEARRDSAAGQAGDDTSSTVLGGILETLYTERFSRPLLDTLRVDFTPAGGQLAAAAYYAELRARLLAVQPVAPGALERLARERGAVMARTLLARPGLDSTRITVADPAVATRRRANSPRVASEMTMDAR